MNVILLGPPGSGKGTQAERLESRLDFIHIASGDLFRDNLKNKTRLGKVAQSYMDRGQLVPDDITIRMVRNRLEQLDSHRSVLLDGFPRTIAQGQALEQILLELGRELSAVIYFQVPEEVIVKRLSGRFICRECQTPFHTEFSPFTECPHGKCNGEFLYQREDDKPDTVRERLRVYIRETRPLIEFYRRTGLLIEIDGNMPMDEVTASIMSKIAILDERMSDEQALRAREG